MELKDIVFISCMVLVLLINPLVSYLNSKIYKQKSKLLEERIDHISKLYLPVLVVIKNYYVDREDYANAQKCKELIENVFEADRVIKNKK